MQEIREGKICMVREPEAAGLEERLRRLEEPETYVDPTLDQLEAERFYFSTFLQQWLYDEHAEAPDAEEVTAP